MRTIYTSVKGLKIPDVEVRYIDTPWIRERRLKLIHKTTVPERVSATIMKTFDDKPVRQAYFNIRKRSYFLDFFFPQRMLAIEIDGSSHTDRKAYDQRRDADFRSIGIRTIRVKNKDVMAGKFLEKLYNRIYKS